MIRLSNFIIPILLGLFWSNVSHSNIIMQDLIDALVQSQNTKSIEVAKKLKLIGVNDKSYDLVFRKANLTTDDAKNISEAIYKINNNGPKLQT